VGDLIREGAALGDGIDKIFYRSQTAKTPFDMSTRATNVEQLEFTGNVDGTGVRGNALPNIIKGSLSSNMIEGGAGADSLLGMGGDDTLDGGQGIDTLIGGDGSDTYKVSNTEDRIVETGTDGGIDTIQTLADYTLGENIENLELLKGSALSGVGNTLANTIYGNENDNSLSGLENNDSLNGGIGNDTLEGATGNDTLEGGEGIDRAVYSGAFDDYQLKIDVETGTLYVVDVRSEMLALDANGNPVYVNGVVATVPINPNLLDGEDYLSSIELLQFSDDSEYRWMPETNASPEDGMIQVELIPWDGNMDILSIINPLEDITTVGFAS
ncbi:MAG: calcium-binding protein, partial [Methylococcaceae bacterium]